MTRHAIQITPGVPVADSHVVIDGHDISTAVRRVTVDMDCADAVPEVRLSLAFVEVTSFAAAEAEVILDEPTREALIALGWTPPPEDKP